MFHYIKSFIRYFLILLVTSSLNSPKVKPVVTVKVQKNDCEDFANKLLSAAINKKNEFIQKTPFSKQTFPLLNFNNLQQPSLADIYNFYNFFKIEQLPQHGKILDFDLKKASMGSILGLLARDLSFGDDNKILFQVKQILEIIKKPSSFPGDNNFFCYLPSPLFSTTQCRLLIKLILQKALLINSYNLIMTNLPNDNLLNPTPDLNAKNYLSKLQLLLKLQMLRLHMPPSCLVNNKTINLRKKLLNTSQESARVLPDVIDSFDDQTACLLAMQINSSFSNIDTLFFANLEQSFNKFSLTITPKSSDCLDFMVSSIWKGHLIKLVAKDKGTTCALSLPYERLDSPSWNSCESVMPLALFISISNITDAFIKRFSEIKKSTSIPDSVKLSVENTVKQLEELKTNITNFKQLVKSETFEIEVQNENFFTAAQKIF